MEPQERREDLEATLAARRELGPGHDEALISGFLDRLEREVAQRPGTRAVDPHATMGMRFVIALVSLGTGIPITAIAASQAGLAGLVVAWAGIVGVNVAARR